MTVTAWVAKHTGLPSFLVTAGEEVTAADGRVLTRGLREDVVSDALAQPGAPTTYTAGGRTVTLTRTGHEWWQAVLTTPAGRVIPGLVWEKDGDPTGWDTGVSSFSPTSHRWPLTPQARTGSSTFTLLDPGLEPDVWSILQHRGPLILAAGQQADALPMRAVVITSVSRKRLSGDGITRFEVPWTQVPLTSPSLDGGRAPIITWGEWDTLDHSWQHRTYRDLCRMIAGMPS